MRFGVGNARGCRLLSLRRHEQIELTKCVMRFYHSDRRRLVGEAEQDDCAGDEMDKDGTHQRCWPLMLRIQGCEEHVAAGGHHQDRRNRSGMLLRDSTGLFFETKSILKDGPCWRV